MVNTVETVIELVFSCGCVWICVGVLKHGSLKHSNITHSNREGLHGYKMICTLSSVSTSLLQDTPLVMHVQEGASGMINVTWVLGI